MSLGERRALVDRDDPDLPIAAQCRLLNVARSTLYYQPTPTHPGRPGTDAADGRALYEVAILRVAANGGGARQDGLNVNRKRVRRLMRAMGSEAIYQKPNTSKGHPDHRFTPICCGD